MDLSAFVHFDGLALFTAGGLDDIGQFSANQFEQSGQSAILSQSVAETTNECRGRECENR